MPSLSALRISNAASSPGYRPVALFVGGSSGIGQGAAEALARYTKGNAHIIVSGRNESAVKSIIAGFPTTPESTYEFLPCDATLMSNITAACASLTSRPKPITKLNYLFLTPGFFSTAGRDDTSEGLDKKFALHFYARWKFVIEIMPLLEAARDAGEDARVVSVLSAGFGREPNLQDPGLKLSYGSRSVSTAAAIYNDLMVEEFASRYPGISFMHTHPGIVRTPMVNTSTLTRTVSVFLYPFSMTMDTSGEYSMHILFNKAFKSGAFHLNSSVEPFQPKHITEEAKKKIYQHLVDSVNF